MKLTIEHLAPYLAYKMIVKIENGTLSHDRVFELDCGHDFQLHLSMGNVKPLLRPLSDLTNEINHRGEKITLMDDDEDGSLFDYGDICFDIVEGFEIVNSVTPYFIMQKLHQYMFDTSGLIESGIAISVHTLDFNPYEK